MIRIAVDAMGGDYAPAVVIEGITIALYDFPQYEITIVGHQGKISYYLEKYGIANHPRVKLVHAEETVEMKEPATAALRGKKNSSITICGKLLQDKKVDAVFSAGHTGAAVAVSTVLVRTLEGIERPAIATVMPGMYGKYILLDAGANPDCEPMNLVQFALMGEAYAEYYFGIDNPRIGLLSVGEEDSKGNELTKETFKKLSSMPINFVGNVEGNTIFENITEVVVCDGFIGNVLLKTCEGLAKSTMYWMKGVFTKNALRKTSAILARNAFRELKSFADAEEAGGAPLLGINGIMIIGHGSSTPKSVRNGIKVAGEFVEYGINDKIIKRVKETGSRIADSSLGKNS
ncbi:MAG: phosphate acyltransferase PlsX [Victivallaceae bacterium]|nr:phosphate acyltransferase PlsX [Victivallaceae bacterium]NLK83071.1 phosphate acyltransferase PlsX [Lentisphaerota bacterium]MDD3116850.1 phosphate acyltransferase PlsX [Victivallaceae bacterium]MDD3702819.1 phosphate acyltransferase PlsX [Victivallaceae bacterium]MDD4317557.1 phosphate acyltransferase PlsX [Victivallaceae bacterium]